MNIKDLLADQAEFAGTNGEFRRIEAELKRTQERTALEETSDEHQ